MSIGRIIRRVLISSFHLVNTARDSGLYTSQSPQRNGDEGKERLENMALTRRLLKGMGLSDEQMDTIIEAHTETVDGLKAEVAKYKADAEALPDIQKQLDAAQADAADARKSSWKVKYDAIKEEFEGYKNEQAQKATHAAKETAYTNLLKSAGISEKRIAAVLKVSDVDAIELGEDGKVKDEGKVTDAIKSEWADFIVTESTSGAKTSTPPANGAGGKTKEEIMKIKDAGERQKAIIANRQAFGF